MARTRTHGETLESEKTQEVRDQTVLAMIGHVRASAKAFVAELEGKLDFVEQQIAGRKALRSVALRNGAGAKGPGTKRRSAKNGV